MSSSAVKMEEQNSDVINETEKWTTMPSMKNQRLSFGATVIGDKIYVAGGGDENDYELSSVEVYDCRSKTWSYLPDMSEVRRGCGVTSVNGKVYVLGGYLFNCRYLESCEMFDPDTNSWSKIPDMKKPRSGCAACSIGDKLYVIGGSNGYTEWVSSVEVFDTITQKWSSLPNMTTKREGCAAVSVGNKIYVFGGHNPYALSSAEVYDVTTQEWTQLPDMTGKKGHCSATAVGNRIYVVGGFFFSPVHSLCEVFDTSTNTWSSPIPKMNKKRDECQAVTIGNKIYVMGGQNGSSCSTTLSSVEMFETRTDTDTSSEETGSRKRSHSQLTRDVTGGQHAESDGTTKSNSLQSDLVYFSSHTLQERIVRLEDMTGLKHESCALLKRMEHLEKNLIGEDNDTAGPISKRIKALEKLFDL